MNSRFALLALSIAIAVLSLALFITVVGATASSVSGVAIGIEPDAVIRGGTDNHLLAYQRPKISQDEPLSLTEPISIYLPLVEYDYIDPAAERAALMALYNSTNGGGWYNNTGWGTDAPSESKQSMKLLDSTKASTERGHMVFRKVNRE